jgi:DNA polymerase-3 subunit epsilon
MVAGKTITQEEVEHFASSAAVVIAHNAGFDRRFVERAFPSIQYETLGMLDEPG